MMIFVLMSFVGSVSSNNDFLLNSQPVNDIRPLYLAIGNVAVDG